MHFVVSYRDASYSLLRGKDAGVTEIADACRSRLTVIKKHGCWLRLIGGAAPLYAFVIASRQQVGMAY